MSDELDALAHEIVKAYPSTRSFKYSALDPATYMYQQERQRAIIRWIRRFNIMPLEEKRIIDIGTGFGSDLLRFLSLGARPQNLFGVEPWEMRARSARERLPAATTILHCSGSHIPLESGTFDVATQATVFMTILDDHVQQEVADEIWRLLKPGGGVLWHDITYNSPRNPHVRGVPLKRIKQLFSKGILRMADRICLAPPISRAVTKIHPNMYNVFNTVPLLRTHVFAYIEKPA